MPQGSEEDEAAITMRAPLKLVNWTDEEGSRFRPAMMGSRVGVAGMVLEDALAIVDNQGISVHGSLHIPSRTGGC